MKSFYYALVSITLAGIGQMAAGDWTTYHGDEALRGGVETRLPAQPVRLWRFNAGASVTRTPVASGDTIVVVSDASEVIALDLHGVRRWSAKMAAGKRADGKSTFREFLAPPAIVEGAVLIGSSDGVLVAFDLMTGAVKWTNSVGTGVAGSVVGFKAANGSGRVAAVSQPDGVLHAFDFATGTRVWSSGPTARCDGSPAFSRGRVVFGSCAAALHVIDVADGRLIRNVDLGPDSQVAGGVALSGDWAFAGTRNGGLVGVDLRDGVIRWTNRDVTGELFTTPAVNADRVVTAADDGKVRCLRRSDGTMEWAAAIGAGPATSPVIAGDTVVAAGGGTLFLLSLSDGKKLWSAAVSDTTSGPAIVCRMIVIGGDDGMVSAFGEETP